MIPVSTKITANIEPKSIHNENDNVIVILSCMILKSVFPVLNLFLTGELSAMSQLNILNPTILLPLANYSIRHCIKCGHIKSLTSISTNTLFSEIWVFKNILEFEKVKQHTDGNVSLLMNVCKTVTGTKTKAGESKTYICQTYATEAVSIQGYFLDRFENVSHNLNLKTKQSANTK